MKIYVYLFKNISRSLCDIYYKVKHYYATTQ
ncbi:hypothetical protein immuto35A_202 [Flavobacterium phage vB_FspM_immuto_3-5A]|uniref:Uncharacterized protein n=1 Tax=Flavobacterium phage vB_FspM_immuto_2-6A TaxID=2801477 RepID=A0A7T8ERJ2_9CAUD|nr:hypothetical protein KNV73_gp068 [Flavobacterium phage vB_FspM_immuto_2-6A]QQO91882.1 hypothetical protein immuto26A_203 [Flavobacterium phage vB_FspM_immuto_2-6A]QQO92120.1 hypothetical protein immuto35A_202 [Flavobacterium phage vB_FspM_immuto_3-5A]QQO92358.1 hypothetical protein immuto136C_202 [Flavobacterium phage vB_FspM_immuto_13-6C]